jgi:capsular polysaccharide biosynthesis protein
VLKLIRTAAVKGIKPWIGEDAWQALRRLDAGGRGNHRKSGPDRQAKPAPGKRLVDTAADSGGKTYQSVKSALPDLDALLSRKPRPRVAILAEPSSDPIADLIQTCYPSARVNTFPGNPEDSLSHAQLAARGPYDLIIDAVADRSEPAGVYRSSLFHLRKGGHLVVVSFRPGLPQREDLWSLITRLVSLRNPSSMLTPQNKDEEALAQATSRVVVGRRHLIAKNATASLVKLREAEIESVLQITGERVGTKFGKIEAERFTPRSVIRDHAETTQVRQQRDVAVPALSLREYNDVICSPGQVVVKENLLLPETYRHHLQTRLVNRVTTEIAPRFAQTNRNLAGAERLKGPYFHFDSEWPGHFGHVLSEQISRLWGWDAAKSRHPDLKVLLGRRPGHDRALPFERAILGSFGIPEADISLIDRPVRVEQLLTATPMFSMPDYVSPRIAPVWNTVGEAVGAQAEDAVTPRRFFCGRERKTRRCSNEANIERIFADAGFEIVFPEHLSFSTQVAMFQNAEVVAGYAGSALFTMIFCSQPKRVLMLSSESYSANNEYLIGAVLGHHFDVFWSKPDSSGANADFTFDLAREGRHLERVIEELGSAS